MIDKLISSYRAQIYDWSAKQWLAFLKKWKPVLISLIFLLLPIGIYVFGVTKKSAIIFCRDYNAAIAFREDLLDLRLLYFRIDPDTNKND